MRDVQAQTENVVVGIDAGGTSVRVAVADVGTGGIRAEMQFAADPDGLPGGLPEAFSGLVGEAESVAAVCAGITKITRTGVQKAWERELAVLAPRAALRVVPDYVIAFHGAISEGTGITVIAGTGSVVYGENAGGDAVRVGGRGWEYGDEGSGTWLTTEVLRRTLRALDGIEQATPLNDAVCDLLDTRDAARLAEAARQTAEREGRGFLVPLVLERARGGDTEASDIFVGCGGWLAAQVRAAALRLGFAADARVPVAMVGGLWEAGDLLGAPFERVVRRWFPDAQIQPAESRPLVGAVRLARRPLPPR